MPGRGIGWHGCGRPLSKCLETRWKTRGEQWAPTEGGDPVRAVAYATDGRFNDAIATAQKAIELARATGQPELVRRIEARLEL